MVTVVAQRSEKVEQYVRANRLPFTILVDESRDVIKSYGVWHRFGLDAWNIARPALFLIDRDGRIQYSFVADRQEEFPEHEKILREIERLKGLRTED